MLGRNKRSLVLVVAPLLCIAGCTSALRAEVRSLREQVGQLRDDVEALKEIVQGPPQAAVAHPRQRVTVIGERGDALRVVVSAHAVLVNGQVVQEIDLADRLDQIAAGNAKLKVIISAKRETTQARVTKILDMVKEAGFKKVSLEKKAAPR